MAQGNVELRGDDDQYAKDAGHQQPLEALQEVLAPSPAAQRKPGGRAGQEEKERHVPVIDEIRCPGRNGAQLVVLDVEWVPEIKDPGRVDVEQQQCGQHAQPVDVPAARRGGRSKFRLCDHRFLLTKKRMVGGEQTR